MDGDNMSKKLCLNQATTNANSIAEHPDSKLKQKNRQWKRDKQHSLKRKQVRKYDKYFKTHDSILETHIPHGPVANKSPHIIIKKWYHRVKENYILLRLKKETDDKKNRKIFYDVEKYGKNVMIRAKENHININLDRTKNKKIILIVRLSDVLYIQGTSFFTETGDLIGSLDRRKSKDCYVILAIFQSEEALRKLDVQVTANNIILAKKYLQNQVVASEKKYHYDTTGTIHGFGFGPVYKSNEDTKHSIEMFAKSEYDNVELFCLFYEDFDTDLIFFWNTEPTYKKASNVDTELLDKLQEKIYHILNLSIDMINNRFIQLRKKLSPKVATIQSNIDFHPNNTQLENGVETKGYLNCHLCINAQTSIAHTEPDALCTP